MADDSSQSSVQSQIDPLPQNLPFEIISKTIGRGAYASVKKGRVSSTGDVFAVKFIHKRYAMEHGRISARQIKSEVMLHQHCGHHANLIQFYDSGEDNVWLWIAMEYAGGGDLFDKIEPDVGVAEDIAHFYFTQLVAGVSYIHGRGVAHRDIKPENILLDLNGNLKIADFGLAVLFEYRGKTKTSSTLCGSPPYVAPEVHHRNYRGDLVDIWSCGVLLFVLLAGNTPWDEPTDGSFEFEEYRSTEGRPSYEPWPSLPSETLSLLRGMMKIDPQCRFTFDDIRRHPWFTRPNPHLRNDGLCRDGVNLATRLIEGLRIDFKDETILSSTPEAHRLPSTQPETSYADTRFDLKRDRRRNHISASQPLNSERRTYVSSSQPLKSSDFESQSLLASLAEDPTMSQFAPQPQVPISMTQNARHFHEICPPQRLTRFYSPYSMKQVLPILSSALHRLGIIIPPFRNADYEMSEVWIPVRTEDVRRCALRGEIVIESLSDELLQVGFSKTLGDPLEWRRLFKKVVVLAKEAVWTGQ
ncbi:Chk1 protein kinase [Rhizina undulata]